MNASNAVRRVGRGVLRGEYAGKTSYEVGGTEGKLLPSKRSDEGEKANAKKARDVRRRVAARTRYPLIRSEKPSLSRRGRPQEAAEYEKGKGGRVTKGRSWVKGPRRVAKAKKTSKG